MAARAKEHGYAGIELGADRAQRLLDGSIDRVEMLDRFGPSDVLICCIDTGLAYTDAAKQDRLTADVLRRSIDAAQGIRCPAVAIAGARVKPGATRSTVAVAMGDWLLPLGDYAAERGVKLLVRNSLSFKVAGEMWLVLDRLSHPAIACGWDVVNGVIAGESPAVSVPTLNSRIVQVHVDDAEIDGGNAASVPLGTGDVPLKTFFTRMRGIGFGGWVVYTPGTRGAAGAPEESLPAAMKYFLEVAEPRPKEKGRGVVKPSPKKGVGGGGPTTGGS
jgi:sugar phosphate isomerase/epimerase